MSAAAILGGHQIDELGRSFSKRRTSDNSSVAGPGRISWDAASCVWENEPMSAAASASVPRLTLQRVSEERTEMAASARAEETERPAIIAVTELVNAPRLAAVKTRPTRPAVPAFRPHRAAPKPPPERANSFPTHQQNVDYLEYEVTSSLTLKETPRSQQRQELQRKLLQRQQEAAQAGTQLVSAIAHHHHTSDSPHVSFAPSIVQALPSSTAVTSTASGQTEVPMQATAAADTDSLYTEPLLPVSAMQSPDQQADTEPLLAISPTSEAAADSCIDTLLDNVADDSELQNAETVLVVSRPASMMTLYESAHSGALSEYADSDIQAEN